MIKVSENIKALIFDCDGTLVDSIPLHFKAWEKTFLANRRPVPYELIDRLNGMTPIEILQQYNNVYHDNLDVKKIAAEKEMRVREQLPDVKPIIPVNKLIHRYKGIIPMAVCSGGHLGDIHLAIRVIGLDINVFEFIISADDGLRSKPYPDMFLETAKRFEVNPKLCQVFEDCDVGILAAKNAGMAVTDIRQYYE